MDVGGQGQARGDTGTEWRGDEGTGHRGDRGQGGGQGGLTRGSTLECFETVRRQGYGSLPGGDSVLREQFLAELRRQGRGERELREIVGTLILARTQAQTLLLALLQI